MTEEKEAQKTKTPMGQSDLEQCVMPACNKECEHPEIPECMATNGNGMICCRHDDHEGPHVACTKRECAVVIWEQA